MKEFESRLKEAKDSADNTSTKVTVLSWRVDDIETAATVPTATDTRPPPEAHEEAKDSESVENYFRQEANQARADDYHFAQQNSVPTATTPTPPTGPHEEAKDSESLENFFHQEASKARADDQFAQQNIRRNQPSATRSTPRPTSKTTSTTPATTPPESPLDELEEEANGSDPVDDYYQNETNQVADEVAGHPLENGTLNPSDDDSVAFITRATSSSPWKRREPTKTDDRLRSFTTMRPDDVQDYHSRPRRKPRSPYYFKQQPRDSAPRKPALESLEPTFKNMDRDLLDCLYKNLRHRVVWHERLLMYLRSHTEVGRPRDISFLLVCLCNSGKAHPTAHGQRVCTWDCEFSLSTT